MLDTSGWDVFKSIADELAKAISGNVTVSGLVLIVLLFVAAAILSERQVLSLAAIALGVLSILLIVALSFGSALPVWYGVFLAFVLAVAALGGGYVLWRRAHTDTDASSPTTPTALDRETIEATNAALERAADDLATQLQVPREKI